MTADLAVTALRAAVARRRAVSIGLGLLQTNVLNSRRWHTREELHYAIVLWIEHTYNRRRLQRGLGRLTPVEYELTFAPNEAARGLICHNRCQLDRQQTHIQDKKPKRPQALLMD